MQIYVNTVKKNRFTIYLLFFFTFKRCTVAKDIYGTFMFDIHADGTVSLILCYHNVLELNFFLRTEFMQWHESKMVGPKHCNLVGEIYRRCSYMNWRNNIIKVIWWRSHIKIRYKSLYSMYILHVDTRQWRPQQRSGYKMSHKHRLLHTFSMTCRQSAMLRAHLSRENAYVWQQKTHDEQGHFFLL